MSKSKDGMKIGDKIDFTAKGFQFPEGYYWKHGGVDEGICICPDCGRRGLRVEDFGG